MAETLPFKYRAFLSYSHHDNGWAKWLHARLEGFRIDEDLIGRETPVGPVPRTLRPIFRDRDDFSGFNRDIGLDRIAVRLLAAARRREGAPESARRPVS